MLDDGNAGGKHHGMHRPRTTGCVVDTEGIDAVQQRSLIAQIERRLLGEERMAFEIGIRAPVPVPAGVDQNRMIAAS